MQIFQPALPYTKTENYQRGSANTAAAGAITVIGAPQPTRALRIVAVQVKNAGATAGIVTLNDDAATVLIAPAGGGDNCVFPIPLSLAVGTALIATVSATSTTIYVNAQGYLVG